MTTTALPLIQDATLTTSSAVYYTCPVNTTAVIKRAVFTNTSGSAVTVTCNVVRSGGSAGTGNVIIPAKAISPNDTFVSPELAGMTLSAGDQIFASCSTGGVVNLMASGVQIV
jgi:hypothetical protein